MGGAAIADLLFGRAVPSGKLPVCFPRMVGQIPIYYSQKRGGKPPSPENVVFIDDIDTFAPQTSLAMGAFHLDTHYTPLFPFGYGLSYSAFSYANIRVSAGEIPVGGTIRISAELSNRGDREAEEFGAFGWGRVRRQQSASNWVRTIFLSSVGTARKQSSPDCSTHGSEAVRILTPAQSSGLSIDRQKDDD